MVKVEKKKIKKPLVITVTAAILAVLMITTFVVLEILIRGGFGTEEEPAKSDPPEIIEGEALYNNSTALMYPGTQSKYIQSFSVNGDNGYFAAKRPKSDAGYFTFYYKDDEGQEQEYMPPICYTGSEFDYTTLYSNSDDGMNTQKLTYVLSSIAIPMFDNRIKLEPNENGQLGSRLAAYGLDTENREVISFTYLDGEEEVTRTVYVGNKLVTGLGYYVQLADRPEYVYVSSSAENFKYALEGFGSFINPRLVMSGGAGDSTAEPILTTGYKQWKNTVYDGKDDWGNLKPTPDRVVSDSTLVFTADKLTSIYTVSDDTDQISSDGYVHSGKDTYQVDLAELMEIASFKRFVNTMVGKAVGSYNDGELVVTIVSDTNTASLGKKYTYKISEIESVITDSGEYTAGAVDGNTLVKVKYSYLIDGEEYVEEGQVFPFSEPCHAVIDLTDERIPADVREYLASSSVGLLGEAQTFDITYTENNANRGVAEYVIKDITLINEIKDGSLLSVTEAGENSIVTYRYEMLSDGEVIDEGIESMPLGQINEDSDEFFKAVKEKLLGKKISDGVNIKVYEYTEYYQAFMNFTAYSVSSVDYFIVRELISSFKFVNPSDRDDFYGESIHQNTLPSTHPYKSYALDWQSCDYVAKILGGITAGSSSTVFEGLLGNEVVDVGLTPENMKEYGLYAYSIYFEIPRGLMTVGDEYEWLDTVGFNLYISERNADGTRYVASDMYDIIVKMDADTLYWVEESFVDFWARRDIVMVQQSKLDKVTATLNFDTFKGKYVFDVEHPEAWITQDGLTFVDPGESVTNKQPYSALNVYASVSGDYTETLTSKLIEAWGTESVHLANVYNVAAGITSGTGLSVGYDTLGDSSFKSFLTVLYGTGYVGTLTEEESAEARKRPAVMTLSFYVGSSSESSVDEYAFDFHYTDDGRVAVVIYRYNASTGERTGERCDFYISNFSLKKIVNSISDLLNGNEINSDAGYKE